MRKLFMKKRLGTPDEIIELIEKKLPEALMLERQLASVIALMPSADPVMVSHRARAAAQAASIAARLVESEKVCKERSEEHTSELQSLMRISYAVFCLKKKNKTKENNL